MVKLGHIQPAKYMQITEQDILYHDHPIAVVRVEPNKFEIWISRGSASYCIGWDENIDRMVRVAKKIRPYHHLVSI